MGKRNPEARYEYNQRITRLEYQASYDEERIQEIKREITRTQKEYDLLLKRFAYMEKALIGLNSIVFEIQDAKIQKELKNREESDALLSINSSYSQISAEGG